jgi:hypothetical protein
MRTKTGKEMRRMSGLTVSSPAGTFHSMGCLPVCSVTDEVSLTVALARSATSRTRATIAVPTSALVSVERATDTLVNGWAPAGSPGPSR